LGNQEKKTKKLDQSDGLTGGGRGVGNEHRRFLHIILKEGPQSTLWLKHHPMQFYGLHSLKKRGGLKNHVPAGGDTVPVDKMSEEKKKALV